MTDVGYIYTNSGKKFYSITPNYKDIKVTDFAHALSQQCRFTGHTDEFYSTAEHSMLVVDLVDCIASNFNLPGSTFDLKRYAVVHDGPEAYLNDIAKPTKYMPQFSAFRNVENRLMRAFIERFKLPYLEKPWVVHSADTLACAIEIRDLMSKWPKKDTRHLKLIRESGCLQKIKKPLTSKQAKEKYLVYCEKYGIK